MKTYSKPYPTIGDLIREKDYNVVIYRMQLSDEDSFFAGMFAAKNGKITSLDGDTYDLEEEVLASEEWTNPDDKESNQNLTIIVKGEYM